MISLELARRLREAGLLWRPAPGDRFVVPDRDMDDEVFVVSEMTIQVHDLPRGSSVIRFNGTTEWALDSIDADEAVWLPRESQLRDLLGDLFLRLEAVSTHEAGFVVVVRADANGRRGVDPDEQRHVDIDAERAYARAVLALLRAGVLPSGTGAKHKGT